MGNSPCCKSSFVFMRAHHWHLHQLLDCTIDYAQALSTQPVVGLQAIFCMLNCAAAIPGWEDPLKEAVFFYGYVCDKEPPQYISATLHGDQASFAACRTRTKLLPRAWVSAKSQSTRWSCRRSLRGRLVATPGFLPGTLLCWTTRTLNLC